MQWVCYRSRARRWWRGPCRCGPDGGTPPPHGRASHQEDAHQPPVPLNGAGALPPPPLHHQIGFLTAPATPTAGRVWGRD